MTAVSKGLDLPKEKRKKGKRSQKRKEEEERSNQEEKEKVKEEREVENEEGNKIYIIFSIYNIYMTTVQELKIQMMPTAIKFYNLKKEGQIAERKIGNIKKENLVDIQHAEVLKISKMASGIRRKAICKEVWFF